LTRFIRISNADGKAWVLPTKGMRTALYLYQPGGIKGKLLKKFLPLLWRFSFVRRLLHIEQVSRPYPELDTLIRQAFDLTGEYAIALFEGTPCVHQKATMQVFQGAKIYGYVKLSDRPSVTALFEKEKEILDYLQAAGVEHVPTCLSLTECEIDGKLFTVFIQDTNKGLNSRVLHDWSALTEEFLMQLEKRTSLVAPFSQTTLYDNIQAAYPVAPAFLQERFAALLSEYEGREMVCCLNHGDFTPWNMYIQDGALEVFDWEYASFCNPVGLDRCHFRLQTGIFEKKLSAEQLVERYIRTNEEKDLYRLYLLHICAHYLRRDPRCVESREMKIWMDILNQI
jgi:hypothetical protein